MLSKAEYQALLTFVIEYRVLFDAIAGRFSDNPDFVDSLIEKLEQASKVAKDTPATPVARKFRDLKETLRRNRINKK